MIRPSRHSNVHMLMLCTLLSVPVAACASEVDEEETGQAASPATTSERYSEVRQLECHLPTSTKLDNRLGTVCAACSVTVQGVALRSLPAGIYEAPSGTFAATAIGERCKPCIDAASRAVVKGGGTCRATAVTQTTCRSTCSAETGMTSAGLFFDLGDASSAYCGCGTSAAAVRCQLSCTGRLSATGCRCL